MKLTRKLVLAKAKASDLESVKKLNCWQVFKILAYHIYIYIYTSWFLLYIVTVKVDGHNLFSIFRICGNVTLHFIFAGDATWLMWVVLQLKGIIFGLTLNSPFMLKLTCNSSFLLFQLAVYMCACNNISVPLYSVFPDFHLLSNGQHWGADT